MTEYALIVDGTFKETRNFPEKPANIPHKKVVWLPVVYENAEYDPRNQRLGPQQTRIDAVAYVKYKEAETLSKEEMVTKVIDERKRRLAEGFYYDFDDARGVHLIDTTEQDLIGWDEVTKAATSFAALGQTTQQINIVTNTGPVTVTATEWLQIIVAATEFRQPIWAASFALQEMETIPADYADDKWWE
jgi:hypothetical protein